LRRGLRAPEGIRAWTPRHLAWVKTLHLAPMALDATLLDYVSEVDHAHERIERLERAIEQAIEAAPAEIRAVIEGLQALRGVARISAATIVAEVGMLSRFQRPKQLMGYSGLVSREHSSGERIRRGAITKTGNAHLRRILVEAAWCYRHRPNVGKELRRRQANASEAVKEIAWKAQHRLHHRYARLASRGKLKQQVATRWPASSPVLSGPSVSRWRSRLPRARRSQPNGAQPMEQSSQRPGIPRKGGPSACLCDRAAAQTRAVSPRQLPTDHDHDGEPRARSANIRVINRRACRPTAGCSAQRPTRRRREERPN
jgi:hypothetical protein